MCTLSQKSEPVQAVLLNGLGVLPFREAYTFKSAAELEAPRSAIELPPREEKKEAGRNCTSISGLGATDIRLGLRQRMLSLE